MRLPSVRWALLGILIVLASGFALNRGVLVGSKIEVARLSDDYPVPFYKKHCRYLRNNKKKKSLKDTGQKQADWRTDPARHGRPEIFNTDQGSQFTGAAFTGLLASNGIAISMDGKGAWRDNVFVERLWRSIKYEEYTCEPTTTSARPAPRSANISTSTMAADRTKALTTPHQIKPTSTNRHSVWRPNPGRRSTYRSGEFCSDNRDQLS